MRQLDERFDRAAHDRLADSVDLKLRERPADQLLGLQAVVRRGGLGGRSSPAQRLIAIRLVGAVAAALLARVSLFVPFLLVASLIASRPARISLRSSSVSGAAADLPGGPAGGS